MLVSWRWCWGEGRIGKHTSAELNERLASAFAFVRAVEPSILGVVMERAIDGCQVELSVLIINLTLLVALIPVTCFMSNACVPFTGPSVT